MSNATLTYSQSEVTTSGERSSGVMRVHHHGDDIGEGHGEVELIRRSAGSKFYS